MEMRAESECIVYKATASTSNKPDMNYYGLCETDFKARFNNHNTSFRYDSKRSSTRLSEYVWSLEDEGKQHQIKWEIAKKASPYRCGTRYCDLCVTEKTMILMAEPEFLLNKRSELISCCRHRTKYRFDTSKLCG